MGANNIVYYRGRRVDNGEVVTGYLWRGSGFVVIMPYNLGVDFNLGTNILTAKAYPVAEESVEICSMLDDKNGKYIFSGDAVKTNFFGKANGKGVNFNDYDTFKVVFRKGHFILENETRRFYLTTKVALESEIVLLENNKGE